MDKIEELFLNGIAAAKGGNRRLAQAFFKRVIKENPYHESAWIWLSEVLDDPDDTAYCLESALAINPHNDKARLTLELIQNRGAEPRRPREWSALGDLLDMDLGTILEETPPPPTPEVEEPPQKELFHGVGRAGIFAGAVLMVLILIVLAAFYARPDPVQIDDDPVRSVPLPTVDEAALRKQERSELLSYFNNLDALLGPLRLAHDIYRGQNSQHNSRVSMADQVAYTSQLRTQVMNSLDALQQLQPPAVLAKAHEEYVQGLLLEEEAWDNLLRYFETSQAGYVNRATVKLQEAGMHMDRANATWTAYRNWLGLAEPTRLPTPTPRSTPTFGPTITPTPTFEPVATPTPTPLPTEPIG